MLVRQKDRLASETSQQRLERLNKDTRKYDIPCIDVTVAPRAISICDSHSYRSLQIRCLKLAQLTTYRTLRMRIWLYKAIYI